MKKKINVPVCCSKEEALTLLDSMEGDSSRQMLSLLRDPDSAATDWFMHVPDVFNESLDIKRVTRAGSEEKVWNQGKGFNFRAGQVLYDSADGYKVWGEALRLIKCVIQVKNALPAQREGQGSVSFVLLRPNSAKTAVEPIGKYTVSQFQFVRILIDKFYLPTSS